MNIYYLRNDSNGNSYWLSNGWSSILELGEYTTLRLFTFYLLHQLHIMDKTCIWVEALLFESSLLRVVTVETEELRYGDGRLSCSMTDETKGYDHDLHKASLLLSGMGYVFRTFELGSGQS
jgi:hypothetical protein